MASINWVAQTNHRLYLSQLMLQQCQQADSKPLQAAFEEAALQQLQSAYLSYLNELAGAVNLRERVESLSQLLAVTSLVTGDMSELRQLEEDSYSWLAQAQRAFAEAGWPQQPVVHEVAPAGLIASSSASDKPAVTDWLGQLQQLIERQRGNHRES
ncbi:DUF6586 family protein [Oceanobacter mangrovi]|uniref:DUF6586 family protein n=1 Tax=Oceanobacter mangrovi TaxID=2862510 RepID=UPI001C8F0CD8|nr:DUF6586 family protein [Oceanobacter mangrovi]